MPMYEFRCPECGHQDIVYKSMESDTQVAECPTCGSSMERDFRAEGAGPHIDVPFSTPIEMHSIAYAHPDDIEEFRRRNPDIETTKDGVPIAHTRAEKLRILKREGYMEKN